MEFIEHPLIKPGSVEFREYQMGLFQVCMMEDTLVVIPTGMGKTVIASLVIADHLKNQPDKRCLLLAPTRPLTHQHHHFLLHHLNIDPGEVECITGEDGVQLRKAKWCKRVICATPQITRSDVERGFVDLKETAVLIYDEAHRAVGNHSYSLISALFASTNPLGRRIGLTASLPSDEEKVKEILQNLRISRIEIRDEGSKDVKPYIQKTKIEWIELTLPPILMKICEKVRKAIQIRVEALKEAGLVKMNRINGIGMKTLLDLRVKLEKRGDSHLKNHLFSLIRLTHALNLLETQDVSSFIQFWDRLLARSRGMGVRSLLEDMHVKEAYEAARGLVSLGIEHPKIAELIKLLKTLRETEKAIVFTSYRDSVRNIYQKLVSQGFNVNYLIGKRGEGGQSQAEQVNALEGLKRGAFNILIATQVGEEGLDISECNLVVFYDNVPSAIRFIQRRGRTGRRTPGRVVAFITKGTRDKVYYWVGRRKLREVRSTVKAVKEGERKGPLDQYLDNRFETGLPLIYVDARESPSIIEILKKHGVHIRVETLDIGDFVVSSEVIIERKTMEDFSRSIMDGRLFKQIVSMKENYPRPVLIIQDDSRRTIGVSQVAYFGALASIISDFQVPVFTSKGDGETAELIYHIARREQVEKKREVRVREGRKPSGMDEIQRYIVAGVPGVSTVLADRLLNEFRSVEKVFTAAEEDLKKVEGIGDKLAKRIRQLSSLTYNPDDKGYG